MPNDSGQDGPEALLAAIAKKCGRSPEQVSSVLTRNGVGLRRSLAVPKRLCLRSLAFSGEKKGEKTIGTIAFDWPDLRPGIWGVTSGRNLRGKSTVLAIVRWCLTGKRSGIPTEMGEWFDAVHLAFTLDGQPYEVEIADAVASKGTLWRVVDDGRCAQATFTSEDSFKSAMSDLFMTQLGLLPLITHTVRSSGESVDQPHDWAFYAGAMWIEPNPENLFGTVSMSAMPTRMMQMFLGIPWASTNADLVAAKGRLSNHISQRRIMTQRLSMRDRLNVSLPVAMISQIGDLATRRKVTRSAVVEAAVASLLSPDSAEKIEAALTRRLDRLTRQMQRQERDLIIALETHALFIRFWLGQMPPLPAEARAAANALGQERFARFLDTLGRRLSQGRSFRDDIPLDIPAMRERPADRTDDTPSRS